MERRTLYRRLAKAERLPERNQRGIEQQRGVLSRLKRAGHDTGAARLQLRRLASVQASYQTERDRLLKELSRAG